MYDDDEFPCEISDFCPASAGRHHDECPARMLEIDGYVHEVRRPATFAEQRADAVAIIGKDRRR